MAPRMTYVSMHHPRRGGESVGRIGSDHHRCGVRLTRLQTHLARQQQFAELHVTPTVGQHLCPQHVIAAPCEVASPHFTRPLAGRRRAPPHHGRMFVRRSTGTVLAAPRTVIERSSMCRCFSRPSPRIRREVTCLRRQRERHRERVEEVARITLVGERCSHMKRSRRGDFHRRVQAQIRDVVAC